MKKGPTTDALKILQRIAGGKPAVQNCFEVESVNREIARKVYQLREKVGLSQAEFARRVGTTRGVISQLEDADYAGHLLAMLNRIAAALQQRVEIRLVPPRRRLPAA